MDGSHEHVQVSAKRDALAGLLVHPAKEHQQDPSLHLRVAEDGWTDALSHLKAAKGRKEEPRASRVIPYFVVEVGSVAHGEDVDSLSFGQLHPRWVSLSRKASDSPAAAEISD